MACTLIKISNTYLLKNIFCGLGDLAFWRMIVNFLTTTSFSKRLSLRFLAAKLVWLIYISA
jgi:hypothetical protein